MNTLSLGTMNADHYSSYNQKIDNPLSSLIEEHSLLKQCILHLQEQCILHLQEQFKIHITFLKQTANTQIHMLFK